MSKQSALAAASSGTSAPTTAPTLAPAASPGLEPVTTGEQAVALKPTEETKPIALKQDIDSDRWAHLAKKEAQVVRERQALAEEKKKVQAIFDKAKAFEDTRKTDPIKALKDLGFSETDIFNYVAEAQPKELTPEQKAVEAAQAEIAKYRDEVAKKEAEAAQARDTQVLTRFKDLIGSTLDQNKDKYEYCAFNGPVAQDLAYNLVTQVFKDSNGKELLTVEQALDEIEKYYEETDKAMSTLKKRTPANQAQVSTPPPTQTVVAQVKPGMPTAPRGESREQKKERLANMIRQQGLRK